MHFVESIETKVWLFFLFLLFSFVISLMPRLCFPLDFFQKLKILFPSWKLFEQFNGSAELMIRIEEPSKDPSPWAPCLLPEDRHFGHLFLNSSSNLRLANYGAIECLLSDIASFDPELLEQNISNCVSYRLVEQIARSEVKKWFSNQLERESYFRFKIQSKEIINNDVVYDDLLISPNYKVEV